MPFALESSTGSTGRLHNTPFMSKYAVITYHKKKKITSEKCGTGYILRIHNKMI